MPTYDVTFKVAYEHTVRVEADDEDSACEQAGDAAHAAITSNAKRTDVGLYSCEIAKAEA